MGKSQLTTFSATQGKLDNYKFIYKGRRKKYPCSLTCSFLLLLCCTNYYAYHHYKHFYFRLWQCIVLVVIIILKMYKKDADCRQCTTAEEIQMKEIINNQKLTLFACDVYTIIVYITFQLNTQHFYYTRKCKSRHNALTFNQPTT